MGSASDRPSPPSFWRPWRTPVTPPWPPARALLLGPSEGIQSRRCYHHHHSHNPLPLQLAGDNSHHIVEVTIKTFDPSPPIPLPQLAGKNSHHIVEATFKAFARALRQACEYDERRAGTIASSKGVLTQS